MSSPRKQVSALTASDSPEQDEREPLDLVKVHVLCRSVVGVRIFPDRDIVFKAVTDTEAAYEALCAEINDDRLHPQLRARYQNAVTEGCTLITQWKATAEAYNDRYANWSQIRCHHRAAFQHAQNLAEHLTALTEVLTVQRRCPSASPPGDASPAP